MLVADLRGRPTLRAFHDRPGSYSAVYRNWTNTRYTTLRLCDLSAGIRGGLLVSPMKTVFVPVDYLG